MTTPTKVIVIGAGWSGVVAAKTYIRVSKLLNRPYDLTVLDESDSPGGCWSKGRLYPGLVANSPHGIYEYSDFSAIDEEHADLTPLPGERVQSYLESYARKFDVYPHMRFGIKVLKAKRRAPGTDQGWIIQTSTNEILECDKLIIATGLYSKPRLPHVPMASYTGISIHSHDLGKRYRSLLSDPSIKNIVVVGGAKSSIETVSVFLPSIPPDQFDASKHAHKHITWVVRPGERGVPIFAADPYAKPNLLVLNNTRIFQELSPSIYNTTGFWYKFFQSGAWYLGTALVYMFVYGATWAIRRAAKFDSSENGRKIKPRGGSMLYDVPHASLVALDHPFLKWLHSDIHDVFEVERTVPIALEGREMVVKTNEKKGEGEKRIPADAVIWCTGWQPAVDFFEPEEAEQLGIPVPVVKDSTSQKSKTGNDSVLSKEQEAEQRILSLFPFLKSNPCPEITPSPQLSHSHLLEHQEGQEYTKYTPYRLHRQILPLSSILNNDRSLAFSGIISNSQTSICSELTALWAVSWLQDLIPSSTPAVHLADVASSSDSSKTATDLAQQLDDEITLNTTFQRLRYGAKGARDPEIVLEIQSFLDTIVQDLGIQVYRKRIGLSNGWWSNIKGWCREWLEPYRPNDYSGVIEEVVENWRRRQEMEK